MSAVQNLKLLDKLEFTAHKQQKNPLSEDSGFLALEIERREVEKMFYGGEEQRLTASAALLKLRYDTLLNSKCRFLKHFMNVPAKSEGSP